MFALLLLFTAPTLSLSEKEIILDNLADPAETLSQVRVYVEPYEPGQPALLGKVRRVGNAVHFEPRLGLTPGLSYRVEAGSFRQSIRVPRPERKPSTRVQVYPSGERLPENLLKFYLQFDAPMCRGDIYKHIRLLDEHGKAIDMPFLELDEELWDPTGKRLTLFLDPGRIKRGLKPREEIGPVLERGKSYTLEIANSWHDADDLPLIATHRKPFTVAEPLLSSPQMRHWRLSSPTV
ncbi:MAG: hypothetical protein SNJ82_03515, partial [Gemmataceae bacterium]